MFLSAFHPFIVFSFSDLANKEEERKKGRKKKKEKKKKKKEANKCELDQGRKTHKKYCDACHNETE
jgi:hypothetical protein